MLYGEAARILKLVENKQNSVKNLTYASQYKNKSKLMALVCGTLKFSVILQRLLKASNLQSLEESLQDSYLAKILTYDMLFGQGVQGTGTQTKAIRKHSALLERELNHLKAEMNVQSNSDLVSPSQSVALPRYVRVNTLKASVADVIEHFKKDGFNDVSVSGCNFDQFINKARCLQPGEFVSDLHMPEMLVFPSGTDLHQHVLCLAGKVLLQDKASCLPVVALNPPRGSDVIDCCAAPGNKSTFIAALMDNEGKIFAFDRDASRLKTMRQLLTKTEAGCISVEQKDFLRVDPRHPKYKDVEYILVDPSCSGSGMTNRIGSAEETAGSDALNRRLKTLSNFQAMLLRHACAFPSVQCIVYSTCSVYEQENELVIHDVLQSVSPSFQLVHILPMLPGRGSSSSLPHAENCVRMSPETSLTIGFFIACLERVGNPPDNSPSLQSEIAEQLLGSPLVMNPSSHVVQIECDEAHKKKKLCRHKKSKKENPEDAAVDTLAMEDGFDVQETSSEKMLIVTEPTDCEMENEHAVVGKHRKSHKHKKSKKEKRAVCAGLERSEVSSEFDGKSCPNMHSPDSFSITNGVQSNNAVSVEGSKLHKNKKLKRENPDKIRHLEYDTSLVNDSSELELERRKHKKSKLEKVHKMTHLEHDTMLDKDSSEVELERRKLHKKHKKSKLEKVHKITDLEHDSTTLDKDSSVLEHTSRKLHKHKKSKREKVDRIRHLENDSTLVKDSSKLELNREWQKSGMVSFVSESDTVSVPTGKEDDKSCKRKKSLKMKAAKSARLECPETNATVDEKMCDLVDSHQNSVLTDSTLEPECGSASTNRKSHKCKKSKEKHAKVGPLEQSVIGSTLAQERSKHKMSKK